MEFFENFPYDAGYSDSSVGIWVTYGFILLLIDWCDNSIFELLWYFPFLYDFSKELYKVFYE